jgi:hypothetical protein
VLVDQLSVLVTWTISANRTMERVPRNGAESTQMRGFSWAVILGCNVTLQARRDFSVWEQFAQRGVRMARSVGLNSG